jgi:hypothetical protein
MRRTAIPLALLAAGAVLACVLCACGKSGYVTTVEHSPAAASAASPTTTHPSTPSTPAAKAKALAYVHAVNLTAIDVPGFTASPKQHSESANERRLEQELRQCTGAQDAQALGSHDAVAQASSPEFELKRGIIDLTVSSEVSVAQSAAQAAGSLSAIHSARVRGCVSRYLTQLLRSEHTGAAKVTDVSIVSGTPPAPGTAGGFGWQVTAKLEYRGVPLSFYLDILGFVDGPSQITLSSSGILRPFPAKAQEQLFTLLLTRAKAHTP